MASIVERPSVPVLYTSFFGKPAENDAFVRLEAVLPSLRGRRFFGLTWWDNDEYRACTTLLDPGEGERLGLPSYVIPGGRYAARSLKGPYEAIIAAIPAGFEALSAAHPIDKTRPAIEYYRRHDRLTLYVPVG